jgi:hypothetical protein
MAPRSGKDDDRSGGAADRAQDPLVARLRPNPSDPPQPVIVLEGLLGDSDREGYRRLYLTRQLDYYAEFRAADVIDIQAIEADQPPFIGEPASRVTLPRDATIDYTRTTTARELDEFDLDIRLGPTTRAMRPIPETLIPRFCNDTSPPCGVLTRNRTCFTCETCVRTRCDTCETCVQTQCDTCARTQCGTCDTCVRTQCGTCETCARTCDTCGIACTAVTCGVRCDTAIC